MRCCTLLDADLFCHKGCEGLFLRQVFYFVRICGRVGVYKACRMFFSDLVLCHFGGVKISAC